jgi:hypothetical protein
VRLTAARLFAGAALCASVASPAASSAPLDRLSLSPLVRVTDFGANADDIGDDTSSFARALAAAHERGGCVSVTAGTFLVSHLPLFSGQRVCMIGAGAGKSIIRHAAPAESALFDSSASAGANVVSVFVLRRLTIHGSMSSVNRQVSAIDIRVESGEISQCEFTSTTKAAIRLRAVNRYFLIEKNDLHDFQRHSGLPGQDTTAILINKDIASTGFVRVSGNSFWMSVPPPGAGDSVGGVAVNPDLDKNQRVEIHNNVFRHMGQDVSGNTTGAIYLYKNADGSSIHHNKILNSYAIAISVQRTSRYTVFRNLIAGEGRLGPNSSGAIRVSGRVPVTPLTLGRIHDNIIRNVPSQACISAYFDAGGEMKDLRIEKNQCEDARNGLSGSYVRGLFLRKNSFARIAERRCSVENSTDTIGKCGP